MVLDVMVDEKVLVEEILELKNEREAIILAHNYQPPEIQDIADFVGDSLELSRKAAATEAKVVVFAGVHFMAETAYILSPQKTILLPEPTAGCPLADMIDASALKAEKRKYPQAAVVCYVNSSAEVKAESDVACTSANAVRVVQSLSEDQIILVPDGNLARYVATQAKKEIIPWRGLCPIHEGITREKIISLRSQHPQAQFIAHPECRLEVLELADEVRSTSGILKVVRGSEANEFIVGTEVGMGYRLQKENPGKKFYFPSGAVCADMKKITLEKVANSLKFLVGRVVVSESIRERAEAVVARMVELA